jgi:hypothetical protein
MGPTTAGQAAQQAARIYGLVQAKDCSSILRLGCETGNTGKCVCSTVATTSCAVEQVASLCGIVYQHATCRFRCLIQRRACPAAAVVLRVSPGSCAHSSCASTCWGPQQSARSLAGCQAGGAYRPRAEGWQSLHRHAAAAIHGRFVSDGGI